MKMKFLITALALLLTLPAAAQFRLITQGYEVALSDVRLPQADGGTIAYKPCSDCDYKTSRLARDARWAINGRVMRLQEFRKRMSSVTDRQDKTLTVTRHVETNRITMVSIILRDSE